MAAASSTTMFAIALLMAGCGGSCGRSAAGTSEEAAVLFAGCTAIPTLEEAGVPGWTYICRDVYASVGDQERISANGLRVRAALSFKTQFAGSHDTETITLGRDARSAERIRARVHGEAIGSFTSIVTPIGTDEHRSATCIARPTPEAEERCARVVEHLANRPRRPAREAGSVLGGRLPLLAGRRAEFPDSCEVRAQANAGRVNCGGRPVFIWYEPVAWVPRQGVIDDLVRNELAGVAVTEVRLPCAIEGVATECRHVSSNENARALVIGAAEVRGRSLVAVCIRGVGSSLPKPCDPITIDGPLPR